MNKPKIAILSSVSDEDRERLKQKRIKLGINTDKLNQEHSPLEDYLNKKYKNITFDYINTTKTLPNPKDYVWYILSWSPSMITYREWWMIDLERFIYDEIKRNKYVLGICFWHQLIASAFGWEVDYANIRKSWAWIVELNTNAENDPIFSKINTNFNTLWSHKQYVVKTSPEIVSLWSNSHTPNQIIKIWNYAWWVQFHPEFTKESCLVLTKTLREDIESSGLDYINIIDEINDQKENEWSRVIDLFIEQLIKNTYNLKICLNII